MKSLGITAISDMHGWEVLSDGRILRVPENDVLVIAGDFLSYGVPGELYRFLEWLTTIKKGFSQVVIIPGNHDKILEPMTEDELSDIFFGKVHFLCDSSVVIDDVLFHGFKWTPAFHGNTWAFEAIPGTNDAAVWMSINKIPKNVDVLITHCPPFGRLDSVGGRNLGMQRLRHWVDFNNPPVHIFGHIHDGWGVFDNRKHVSMNVSFCDEAYQPRQKVIVFDFDVDTRTVSDIEVMETVYA